MARVQHLPPIQSKSLYVRRPCNYLLLVSNRAQVNTCDNFKWTPLHHACLAGQLDIVQRLVEAGADMNAQALNGGTPLMRAIQTGSPNVVQYLINRGCSVQLENRKGKI